VKGKNLLGRSRDGSVWATWSLNPHPLKAEPFGYRLRIKVRHPNSGRVSARKGIASKRRKREGYFTWYKSEGFRVFLEFNEGGLDFYAGAI
jgi:hypothetical protein